MFRMLDIVTYNLFDTYVFHFFSEIEDIKLLIKCGGHWKESIYKDDYSEMLLCI